MTGIAIGVGLAVVAGALIPYLVKPTAEVAAGVGNAVAPSAVASFECENAPVGPEILVRPHRGCRGLYSVFFIPLRARITKWMGVPTSASFSRN